jgi:acyl dehydratase
VFHGDTLFCESEVLESRESQSKPRPRHGAGPHARAPTRTACSWPSSSRLVLGPARGP